MLADHRRSPRGPARRTADRPRSALSASGLPAAGKAAGPSRVGSVFWPGDRPAGVAAGAQALAGAGGGPLELLGLLRLGPLEHVGGQPLDVLGRQALVAARHV